uniref:Uncharacterized protein n=1 Tax=Ciona savignyi TaxID=51511 RepID=H2ZF40_CIOSA
MGMFSCTLFGMFGMAFGMNLDSSFEENPLAFWVVSGVMFAGAGLSWRLMLRRLRDAPLHGTSSANKLKESEFSSSCSTANKGGANIMKHDKPQLKDNATQFYLKTTLHNNDISKPRMKPLGSSGIFSQYEERNKRNIRFLHTLPFAL